MEQNEKTLSFFDFVNTVALGAMLCLLIVGCFILFSNACVLISIEPREWLRKDFSDGLTALGESVVSGAICVAIGLFFVKLDFFLSTFSLIKILQSSRPNSPDGGDDAS